MPRLVTFVNNDILESLQKIAKQSGKSLSKISGELIEAGYQETSSGKEKTSAKNIRINKKPH